jgi:isopentenyldiphosphate isomerase
VSVCLGHSCAGISPQQLPPSALKFLTRLHYCAPDSGTYGEGAPWGEHEIDYILVAQVRGRLLVLQPSELSC